MKLFKLLFPAVIALMLAFAPAAASAQTTDDITAQVASLPAEKIVSISRQLLDTPIAGNEETVASYGKIILIWLTNSDNISITLNSVQEFGSNPNLLAAFLAAEIINMNDLGITTSDKASYIASMKDLLKYYKANRKSIGKVPGLRKFHRLTPEEIDSTLAEMYDNYAK
ncbi:MAG: hypothetical protein K2H48_00355 [Duncaniella sp.]|nr:hypothetical protein [Duncaniella sp.]